MYKVFNDQLTYLEPLVANPAIFASCIDTCSKSQGNHDTHASCWLTSSCTRWILNQSNIKSELFWDTGIGFNIINCNKIELEVLVLISNNFIGFYSLFEAKFLTDSLKWLAVRLVVRLVEILLKFWHLSWKHINQ